MAEPGKATPASSFDAVAEVYDSARPGYPQEAADWLMPDDAHRVADIGAGTGKFTRLLIRAGRDVVAVDPSSQMLEHLHAELPQVDARAGSAERIPLPDASVDAVTFAQAWHWVDVPAASAEVGRVLRPGGTLGLLWNLRDERLDWMREFGIAMRADGDRFTGMADPPEVSGSFVNAEYTQFAWTHPYTRDGLLDLVRSRSYFALMSAAEQEETLAAVSDVIDSHPQVAGQETIDMPYVTACFRYVRP